MGLDSPCGRERAMPFLGRRQNGFVERPQAVSVLQGQTWSAFQRPCDYCGMGTIYAAKSLVWTAIRSSRIAPSSPSVTNCICHDTSSGRDKARAPAWRPPSWKHSGSREFQ